MQKLYNRKVIYKNREILCEIENYWNLFKFMDKTKFVNKYLNPNLVNEFEKIIENFNLNQEKSKETRISRDKIDKLIDHVIQYNVAEKIYNDDSLSEIERTFR